MRETVLYHLSLFYYAAFSHTLASYMQVTKKEQKCSHTHKAKQQIFDNPLKLFTVLRDRYQG